MKCTFTENITQKKNKIIEICNNGNIGLFLLFYNILLYNIIKCSLIKIKIINRSEFIILELK